MRTKFAVAYVFLGLVLSGALAIGILGVMLPRPPEQAVTRAELGLDADLVREAILYVNRVAATCAPVTGRAIKVKHPRDDEAVVVLRVSSPVCGPAVLEVAFKRGLWQAQSIKQVG